MRRILFIAAGTINGRNGTAGPLYTTSRPKTALEKGSSLSRLQGRRGQVRYHYMRLQFVRLSTRPPKSMWENSSDDSDSDSSRRKRKRGRPIRTLASSKRGKVSAGSSAPIPASTKTSKVTAEETYEEETGIVWTEFLSQPSTPSCAAPCCVSSEDQGAQSFYNSCDGFVAALGQRSLPSLLQQPPAPWADVGECMTTTSDYPACGALAPSFPLDGASLSYLDFTNNTNTCVDNFWG